MASGHKWIPPLPPGWEARYDPNQKAFFFIDHENKVTQWEDPRFQKAAVPAPPPPPPQNNSAAAFQSLGNTGGGRSSLDAVPLQDFSPPDISSATRNHRYGESNNQYKGPSSSSNVRTDHLLNRSTYNHRESSLTSEANRAVIDKLKNDYPGAPRELISDMFSLCHYNERETREQLDDLGFAGSRKSSAHVSPQHGATSNESSPQRHSHSQQHHEHHHKKKKQQPKKEDSPAKEPAKELSEAQKHRLFEQLKHDFPKSDANVVKIALESCKYNLADAKTLIAAWEKKVGSKNGASSSAREDRASTSSPAVSIRPTSPPSETLEPAGLLDTATNKPQGLGNAQQNAYRPGFRPSPKKTTPAAPKTNVSASTSGRDTHGTKAACPQHARAKQVTRMSEHLLNTTNDLLTHLATTATCCFKDEHGEDEEEEKIVVEAEDNTKARPKQQRTTTQTHVSSLTPPHSQGQVAQGSNVTSECRTQAKGPDPSLRHGPDSSLLTSDYTQANGPDKSLRVGPDRSCLSGPQGALGPDITLRCGPQSTLLEDNKNNSFERIASPSGILVSHI